ncbi:MAG: dephospho-CoA kinase [Planctomycetes bacterium]|nr:dephospho-CoA kinase [Planctomycetota bacterium]
MPQTSQQKPVIGIIGGIGSGKSTVATEFSRLGCAVIDADQIAHSLLSNAATKQQIKDHFGPHLLTPRGDVNRKQLAEIVFRDPEKLSLLNSILHPQVLGRCETLLREYGHSSRFNGIVLDMPLLVEVGWHTKCDHIIFIACDQELRLERIRAKGPFSRRELEMRESFQISLDTKQRHADTTIHNSSDLSVLTSQITEIFSKILNR